MWKQHDNYMKKLKQLYSKTSKQTQLRFQEIFDTFSFTSENIYDIADNKTKRKINVYIESWKDKKMLTGYFGMLANNIYRRTRVKNSEILELLIYSAYVEEQNKLEEQEKQIMYNDTNYYYQQGQKEVKNKKSFSVLEMALFLALLEQQLYNGYTFNQNIEAIIKYNTQQIYKQYLLNIAQSKENDITDITYQKIIQRQQNTKLNINGDKISGNMDLIMIGLNNKAKAEGMYLFDKDAKVKFIAVQDDKTTKMCDSLDEQIFKVHGWNEFYRYSDTNKSKVKVKCFGLVYGLNLPPIDDHFHYCRSTLMYLPLVEKQEKVEYNIPKYLHTRVEKFYKNSLEDFKKIQKEYDMLPQNVKNQLEKENVTIVLNPNMNYSGYDFKTKRILLIPGLEKGEFIHEIGHALEHLNNITNNIKYKNIVKDILNKNAFQLKNDKNIPYLGMLNEDKCISSYQTFLGFNIEKASQNVKELKLPELISEAYRAYYFEKDKLKINNYKLFEFIEEIEKNAR